MKGYNFALTIAIQGVIGRKNGMVLAKILAGLKLSSTSLRSIHTSQRVFINFTPILLAEPLKKKKKLDPAILKQREERKKKKLEKQIRRLERNARQLKPVDECEVPLQLLDEKQKRARPTIQLPLEEVERRAILNKQWAKYKMQEKSADFQLINRIIQAQQRALDELRSESEDLYQEAIQPDLQLLPIKIVGPVATPPIPNYESPDGEYIDISRKWD